MKNWNNNTESYIETPENITNFLKEIEDVYLKYGLSISHEDGHGAFIIEDYDKFNIDWLSKASLNINQLNKLIYVF